MMNAFFPTVFAANGMVMVHVAIMFLNESVVVSLAG